MVKNAKFVNEISYFRLLFRFRNILKLCQVLRQNKMIVKDKPKLVLRVTFLYSEHGVIILVRLWVN